MPILVTGRSTAERRRGACEQSGFTLLELLVACLIVGILAATISFAMPQRGAHLAFEADRLARLLAIAKEEALLRAAPIRLDSDPEGYRFLVWRERRWQLISEDPMLRARRWEVPTDLRVVRADGGQSIESGREPLDPPIRIWLQRPQGTAIIEGDGLGQFAVRTPGG